jgi:hypothetical protein
LGTFIPPIELKLIEGKTTVTNVYDESLKQSLRVGDHITIIDHEDINSKIKRLSVLLPGNSRFILHTQTLPASTKQALNLKIHQKLLAGEKDSKVVLGVTNPKNPKESRNVTATRTLLSLPRTISKVPPFAITPGQFFRSVGSIYCQRDLGSLTQLIFPHWNSKKLWKQLGTRLLLSLTSEDTQREQFISWHQG